MISILGTGVMGCGIAIEFSKFDYCVQLIITGKESVGIVKEKLWKNLRKYSDDEKKKIIDRIDISTELALISNSELIIEAVTEDLDIKKDLVRSIKPYLSDETILASNTSSLSIKSIFDGVNIQSRVIGIHFFNPVRVMKLVELVMIEETSDYTLSKMKKLVESLNKETVIVKNSPGFIVNRLLIPMLNEAAKIVDEGIASIEDIDKAMKLGANHPIGPLKLSDLIGNDVTLAISEVLLESNEVSFGLRNIVDDKQFGRKSGEGFYKY